MTRLFTYVFSHNLYHDGGRKIHITIAHKEDESVSLCGIFKPFTITCVVDQEWLNQPDVDGDVCIKCRKSAKNILTNNS